MSLFKRKNTAPALFVLLDDEFNRAKQQQEKHYFFHLLYDNERDLAWKWCQKNNVYMEVDHQTDGNIFYKFKF